MPGFAWQKICELTVSFAWPRREQIASKLNLSNDIENRCWYLLLMVRPQTCTCHDSSAVVASAALILYQSWDYTKVLHITAIHILFTILKFWTCKKLWNNFPEESKKRFLPNSLCPVILDVDTVLEYKSLLYPIPYCGTLWQNVYASN